MATAVPLVEMPVTRKVGVPKLQVVPVVGVGKVHLTTKPPT